MLDQIYRGMAAITWPIVALIFLLVVGIRLKAIGELIRRAPLIRKIKFADVEIELDRGNLDEIKTDTDKTFKRLVSQTDGELKRFSALVGIEHFLSAAANNIVTNLPDSQKAYDPKANARFTVHIHDFIFERYLFQLTDYVNSVGQKCFITRHGFGRRFSIHYGIIGKCARMRNSFGTARAFQDGPEKERDLMSHWSMLPEQALTAARKPSCLAIALKHPKNQSMIGILYGDAEITGYFGDNLHGDDEIDTSIFTELPAVKKLAEALADIGGLTSNISLNFDLTNVGSKT